MIAYDLQCKNGHTFEGWFEDGKAFEKQQKQGLITCPMCDDSSVCRIPSTFGIKGAPSQPTPEQALGHAKVMARAIAHYVEKNFDNVGSDFAKEALKIHYGVSEPRNIRGVSTSKEEETLRQEGVEFVKFPLSEPSTPPSTPTSSSSSSESDS